MHGLGCSGFARSIGFRSGTSVRLKCIERGFMGRNGNFTQYDYALMRASMANNNTGNFEYRIKKRNYGKNRKNKMRAADNSRSGHLRGH